MKVRSITLSDAIDQYQGFLKARSMAHNTIRSNMYLLRRALAVWGNVNVNNLQGRHVDRLFAEGGWNERTHNTQLQILKAFFGWCRAQGFMAANQDPAYGWRNRKVPALERARVPVEQFAELLDAAEHPRDRALIAVGLFLFVRSGEASNITIQDVDFAKNTVRVWREKTKEEDILPMCSELRAELLVYLDWYRRLHGNPQPNWFLLPARKAGGLVHDPQTGRIVAQAEELDPTRRMRRGYQQVQSALERIGVPVKGEGGHTLRRSGARALADQLRDTGYDGALLRVASMLGHKSTKITEHYVGWSMERGQRNEALAGREMFPGKFGRHGDVVNLRRAK